MSILETFYILFKSDASQVKKGNEEAKKSTDELNSALKNTSEGTNEIGEAFNNMGRSLLGTVTALLSVGAVLSDLKAAFEYSFQLNLASKALNVNAAELDAWGQAVTKNGGTVIGFQQSLKSLATNLNIRNQDALSLLPFLGEKLSKVSTERAMGFGQSIGLDQATLLLLMKGGEEVKKIIAYQKELGTVSRSNTEAAAKFKVQWVDSTTAFRTAWENVNDVVLPVIGGILDKFTEFSLFLKHNSNIVIGALIGIGTAATIFLGPIVLGFIAANAAVLGTILAVGLLIAAFALLYDDIKAFAAGNDSVIGSILHKWPIIGKVIRAVFDDIRKSIRWVLDIFKEIKDKFNNRHNVAVTSNIQDAKNSIKDAEINPIGSQTSNSIFNTGFNSKDTSILTGPITVYTQPGDSTDIVGGALARGLKDQLKQANYTFADGQLI